MATGFEFFERDLRVATAGMETDAINRMVAEFARQELHRVIADGSASPQYDRFVNGVAGASEDAYRAPGAIVYEFLNWPLVITSTLEELKRRSPVGSGRFASSFIVIVAGRIVVTDFTKLRSDAEIVILNTTPYSRKAETGYLGIPEQRLFAGTGRAMARRFSGAFSFTTRFLTVPSGIYPGMPYILKVGDRARLAARSNRSAAYRAGREFLKVRNAAGQPITYPAVVINRAA